MFAGDCRDVSSSCSDKTRVSRLRNRIPLLSPLLPLAPCTNDDQMWQRSLINFFLFFYILRIITICHNSNTVTFSNTFDNL